MDMNFYDKLIVISFGIGGLIALVFFAYATYLSHKWLPSVEMTMTGHNVHTANWFFSIHAVILFGSVFAWDWHARRQKSVFDDRDWYEARKNVPIEIRRKFIFAFFLLLISGLLMFGPTIVLGPVNTK